MNNIQKLVLISLLVLIISTISMTYLYILFDDLMELNLKTIIKIVTQIGLVGGIILTSIFVLIYYLIKRIKNIWLLTLTLIGLFFFLIFLSYWFFLAMMSFRLEDSQSFFNILLEVL